MVYIPFGYAQVTLEFTGPTRSGGAATVLGINTGDSSDLNLAAERVAQAFFSELRSIMHQAFRLVEVRAVDTASAGTYIETNGQGQRTGDLAPPNTSVLVSKGTVLRGRAFRGRSYWPGLLNDGDVYDDGSLSPGAISSIQGHMDDFWEALADPEGITQVILHGSEVEPTPVTTYGVSARAATQRRRLR